MYLSKYASRFSFRLMAKSDSKGAFTSACNSDTVVNPGLPSGFKVLGP